MMFRRLSKKVSQTFNRSESRRNSQNQPPPPPNFDPFTDVGASHSRGFTQLSTIPETRPYIQNDAQWGNTQNISRKPVPSVKDDETMAWKLLIAEMQAPGFDLQAALIAGNSTRRASQSSNPFQRDSVLNSGGNSEWESYNEEMWETAGHAFANDQRQRAPLPTQYQTHSSNGSSWRASNGKSQQLPPISSFQLASIAENHASSSARRISTNPFLRNQVCQPPISPPQAEPREVGHTGGNLRDCAICADEKPVGYFPRHAPTKTCEHEPNACLDCLQTHIRTQLVNGIINERSIRCPECPNPLDATEIQKFADPETFALYSSRASEGIFDQIANFFRCPNANCGSAQIHDSGEFSPIVTCIKCRNRFCFRHRVRWHQDLTCADYDRFLADPDNFRSQLELDNEQIERELAEGARRRRAQEESDQRYVQSLLDAEEREEAQRLAAQERQLREQREREERARLEAQQREAHEQRRRMRQEAERKQREEQANLSTISRTTKNCPSCRWPIEKNAGCAHMTCIKCRYEFCWGCLRPYGSSHGLGCRRR